MGFGGTKQEAVWRRGRACAEGGEELRVGSKRRAPEEMLLPHGCTFVSTAGDPVGWEQLSRSGR